MTGMTEPPLVGLEAARAGSGGLVSAARGADETDRSLAHCRRPEALLARERVQTALTTAPCEGAPGWTVVIQSDGVKR